MIQISDLEDRKNEWLIKVKKGDSKSIELLYKAYRENFLSWLQQQTNCSEQEALDIFQESVLRMYKYIKMGKLTEFKSSIKWYLFRIGKNIFLKRARKKKLEINNLAPMPQIAVDIDLPSFDEHTLDEQEEYLLKLLRHLREPCSAILYLYYYEKLKIKDIAQEMGYKNANIVSIQKGRCLKKIREMLDKKFGTS